jgi:hypothetical protein
MSGKTRPHDWLRTWRIEATPWYKPGDLPPKGYLQWHEWAEVQRKAGIKQVQCPTCGKWQTPQELSTHEVRWTGKDRRGKAIHQSAFQCAQCFEKAAACLSSSSPAPLQRP